MCQKCVTEFPTHRGGLLAAIPLAAIILLVTFIYVTSQTGTGAPPPDPHTLNTDGGGAR